MATHYAREQCVQYARTSKEETAESAVWEVSSEMRCDPQRKVERNRHPGVGAADARAHLLQDGVRKNAPQVGANGVAHNQCAGHMSCADTANPRQETGDTACHHLVTVSPPGRCLLHMRDTLE